MHYSGETKHSIGKSFKFLWLCILKIVLVVPSSNRGEKQSLNCAGIVEHSLNSVILPLGGKSVQSSPNFYYKSSAVHRHRALGVLFQKYAGIK